MYFGVCYGPPTDCNGGDWRIEHSILVLAMKEKKSSTRVWRAGESGNRLELRVERGWSRPVALTALQRWPHSGPELKFHNGVFSVVCSM